MCHQGLLVKAAHAHAPASTHACAGGRKVKASWPKGGPGLALAITLGNGVTLPPLVFPVGGMEALLKTLAAHLVSFDGCALRLHTR